jgi:DNA polymerase III subunit delta'
MLFKEIYGQAPIKEKLLETLMNGHIAHAQLFWGSDGSAALAMARAYCQYLHCQDPKKEDACGVCDACKKNQRMIHSDHYTIFPVAKNKKIAAGKKALSQDFMVEWQLFLKSFTYPMLQNWLQVADLEEKQPLISVEESRNLNRILSLKPVESKFKTIILWLPELLNLNAANAMLKLLEEPTQHTVFILVSANRNQMLPTILSRVQAVQITDYTDAEIVYFLKGQNLDDEKAKMISLLCEGNINLALQLIQEPLSVFQDFVHNWLRECFGSQQAKSLPYFEKLIKRSDEFSKMTKNDQKSIFKYTTTIFRESLYFQSTQDTSKQNTASDFVVKFSKILNIKRIEKLTSLMDHVLYLLERNANAKILFLDASLKIHQFFKS